MPFILLRSGIGAFLSLTDEGLPESMTPLRLLSGSGKLLNGMAEAVQDKIPTDLATGEPLFLEARELYLLIAINIFFTTEMEKF